MERRSTMPMDAPNPSLGLKRRASAKLNGAARQRSLSSLPESLDYGPRTTENCFVQLWNCIKGSSKYRDHKLLTSVGGINSVSNIDQLARIMFPVAFSSFHIFYWMCYLGSDTVSGLLGK